MKIINLKKNDFVNNIQEIKKLLMISYNSNFDVSDTLKENIVDLKIKELEEYIELNKAIVYVAYIDNSIVGFTWIYVRDYFEEKRIHINHIIVDEMYRGKGIAKKLLIQVEKYAKYSRIKVIDLFVSEENLTALNLYEKMEYVTERRLLKKTI